MICSLVRVLVREPVSFEFRMCRFGFSHRQKRAITSHSHTATSLLRFQTTHCRILKLATNLPVEWSQERRKANADPDASVQSSKLCSAGLGGQCSTGANKQKNFLLLYERMPYWLIKRVGHLSFTVTKRYSAAKKATKSALSSSVRPIPKRVLQKSTTAFRSGAEPS